MFRYGLVNRPASFGAVPKGAFTLEPRLDDECGRNLTRHGIIVYERELTDDELYAFELCVIADDVLIEKLSMEVSQALSEYAHRNVKLAVRNPTDFAEIVFDRLRNLRKYRVHVGDKNDFVSSVLLHLYSCLD